MNLKKLFILIASVAAVSTISGCSSPKLSPFDEGFLSPPPSIGANEFNKMGDIGVKPGGGDIAANPEAFKPADGPIGGGDKTFDEGPGGNGVRWKEGIVYFGFDQSSLAESEYPKVNALVEHLKANPVQLVLIEGHCDSRGSDEYNRGLGERRANSIRDYMVTAGIAAERIQTISWGEEKPAVANPQSEEEYSQNRRGEFVLGKK